MSRDPHATAGTITVPTDFILGLVTRVRLSGASWRVLFAILTGEEPISAGAIARQLKVSYPFAKALVRRLRVAGLVQATPAGLVAIFNPRGWQDAAAEPAAGPSPSTSGARTV